jgi:hypothetical protein
VVALAFLILVFILAVLHLVHFNFAIGFGVG